MISASLEQLIRAVLAQGPGQLPDGLRLLSSRPDRYVVLAEAHSLVIKVYADRGGLRGVGDRLFGSRAARMVRRTEYAAELGLPVPRAHGVIRARGAAAAVIDAVKEARTLHEAARAADRASARRALVGEVAALLRTIHDAGVFPGDLHQGNILVGQDGHLTLIDADGLRFMRRVPLVRRVRNIERLLRDFTGVHALRRTERLRFLLDYADSRREAHLLWRLVAPLSLAKCREYGIPPPR